MIIVDDFWKAYEDWVHHKLLTSAKQRNGSGKLTLSEALSILIFYHFSEFKHFTIYYQTFVLNYKYFKNDPCYDMFIQIIPLYSCQS